jgi:HK97 family phage major capsid protein
MPEEVKVSNPEAYQTVAAVLREKFAFATVGDIDRAVLEIREKTEQRTAAGDKFSMSRAIRGMRALKNEVISAETAEEDVKYLRALATGATPGSYLVPTIQANEIIGYLTAGGAARRMGVRVWPMNGIQKLNVPAASGLPTWEWLGENTAQSASDPNVGQMAFDLKERRALVAVPNQLLAVSVPAFDSLLSELIGIGAAEHEDTAFFGTTSASNGPTALYAKAGISAIFVGGSANGGDLAYTDLLSVLEEAAAVKAKGPFVWAMSPRTFYQRVLGLVDLNSRPIVVPVSDAGLAGAPNYMLFGSPVIVTPAISESETNGSGTSQSHIIYTNPKYCHIAQDGNIEFGVSMERYFEVNQTAVRAVQHEDFGYSPVAGIVVLKGVN